MRPPAGPSASGVAYWEARAEAMGPRAVLSTDHEGTVDGVTDEHRALLLPAFSAVLGPSDRDRPRTVLDLGCGSGRLTADLAQLAGRAIGVDPVAALLQLAPPAAGVEYRLLADPSGPLPLRDGEADAAFTCLVLGGIEGPQRLAAVGAELYRVLAPGSPVLLAESVSDQPAVEHWTFRSVTEYRAAFPWADLQEIARFDDAGDQVSVLAGRRPG